MISYGLDPLAQISTIFRKIRSTVPKNLLPLVSEWATENRILSKVESARPGAWDWDYMSHTKEIADCFSVNSPIREVAVMKGTQVGFTDGVFLNLIGYTIDYAPRPMLFVSADKQLLKDFKNIRISSMIQHSGLAEKIKADNSTRNSRRTGDTATMIEFSGGFVRFCGTHNPADLRSFSVPILMLDEIDGYPLTTPEGPAIGIAKKRTDSFGKSKKIGYISTPTDKLTSRIEPLYESGDKRKRFVPCPHCEKRQILIFYNYNGGLYPEEKKVFSKKNRIMHAPYGFFFNSAECRKGNYSSVGYKCKFCGEIMKEHHKRNMFREGNAVWAPTAKTKIPYFRSYHLPTFYSTAKEWWEIVRDFLEAKGDVNKLKTFHNTNCGETFDDTTQSITKHNVYPKRMDYLPNVIQAETRFIVAACDVQHDRLELVIVGVGRNYRMHVMDYRVLYGDTGDKNADCWEKLRKIGDEKFYGGGWKKGLYIDIISVDSGDGNRTNIVYEFCQSANEALTAEVFYPLKGMADTLKTRHEFRTVKLSNYNLTLIEPYSNLYKNKLSSWLSREWRKQIEAAPLGWIEFPACFSDKKEKTIERFLHQLTAEKKVKVVQGAVIRLKWLNEGGKRNEAFDCLVYAVCLIDVFIEKTCRDVLKLVDENGNFKIDLTTVFDDLDEVMKNS